MSRFSRSYKELVIYLSALTVVITFLVIPLKNIYALTDIEEFEELKAEPIIVEAEKIIPTPQSAPLHIEDTHKEIVNNYINYNESRLDTNLYKEPIAKGTILYVTEETQVTCRYKDELYDTYLAKGDKITVVADNFGVLEVTCKKKTYFIHKDFTSETCPTFKITATCYYNEFNNSSASGRELVEGHSLAGRVCWIGRTVKLYRVNEDGTQGEYIGTYRFDDTGYGKGTGYGTSSILKDTSIGTIENGTCIDIYYDTYAGCKTWGKQDVYIEFVD